MNMAYPVSFKNYPSGQVGAFFTDVPEAITAGQSQAQAQALDYAQDALTMALSSYVESGKALPVPSKAKRGQQLVVLPPRIALKLAIADAMRKHGMTQERLGAIMGVDVRQVRRMLDLHHESKLSQLDAALHALGLRAAVSIQEYVHALPT